MIAFHASIQALGKYCVACGQRPDIEQLDNPMMFERRFAQHWVFKCGYCGTVTKVTVPEKGLLLSPSI